MKLKLKRFLTLFLCAVVVFNALVSPMVVYGASYTITFNPNGGTYNGSSSNTSKTVSSGSTVTFAGNPTRTGYTFNGWNLSAQTIKAYTDGRGGDMSHTAGKWTSLDRYGTTSNGCTKYKGTVANNSTSDNWIWVKFPDYSVAVGEKITVSGELRINSCPVQMCLAHYFHWNDWSGQMENYSQSSSWKTFSYSRTSTENSSTACICLTSASLASNSSFAMDIDLRNIKIERSASNYKGSSFVCYDGNMTATAQWTPHTYTVVYNANGGTGTTASSTHTYGVAKALTANGFSKTGYYFGGWATSSTGGAVYANGASVSNLTATNGGTVNLYAVWIPNIYTITLNNQSATSAGSTAYYEKYNVGNYSNANCTTAITAITKPARTGYTFGGYYTGTGGSGTQYVNASGGIGSTSTTFTAHTTLYAKWTPNVYTVSLDNQSATTAGTTTYYVKYDSGFYSNSACSTAISSITCPTRTGYTFGGYYTGTGGSGTQYVNASGVISSASKSSTITKLYAKWTVNTYSVKYNANGGSGSMSNSSHTYGVAKNLTANAFSRTGYTFKGWATSSAGAVAYADGASVSNLTATNGGTVNLYAVWEKIPYTVSFNANGGSTSAMTKTYYYGDSVNLSATAQKEGYTFVGWATSSGATKPLSSYTMGTSSVTLYAVYTIDVSDVENHKYPNYSATSDIADDEVYFIVWIKGDTSNYKAYPLTYMYDANRMVYNYVLPTTDVSTFVNGRAYSCKIVAYDNAGNIRVLYENNVDQLPIPEEYQQTVKHYRYDASSGEWIWFDTTQEMVEEGKTFTPSYITPPAGYRTDHKDNGDVVSSGKTYNAYYMPIDCTITFETNGGICNESERTLLYGAYYGKLPAPVKTGYTFMGWNTKEDGTGRIISSNDVYEVVGDSTVYAQWTPNIYTVSLDNQSATTSGTTDFYVKYNTGYYSDLACSTAISSITCPTRTGYTFGGYYTGIGGTGTQCINKDGVITSTNTDFTKNTVLYAKWDVNTYTISYNANGGSGDMADTIATYDTFISLRSNAFTRTGYTFKGWAISEDGEVVFNDKDSVSNLTATNGGTVNLYAVWEINSYTVIYDYWTNGGEEATLETETVNFGSNIDLTPIASKESYVFVGWNTDPTATTKIDSLVMSTGNVTLYAIFEKTIVVNFIEKSNTGDVTTTLSDTIFNNETHAYFLVSENADWDEWKNIGWTDKTDATEDAIVSTGATYSTSENITLYALYSSDVTISYDTNGSSAEFDSQTKERFYNASGNYFYPTFTIASAPSLSSHSFAGWRDSDGGIYDAGMVTVIKKTTTLTAVWDSFPKLEVYDRYFTLEQAQNGEITEEELLKKVVCTDLEDGTLENGRDVIVLDYNPSLFLDLTKDKDVEIVYQATDSFGNVVTKAILVSVVDASVKESTENSYVRFISDDYYASDGSLVPSSEGGLETTSVWRTNEVYARLLSNTLSNYKEDVVKKPISLGLTESEIEVAGSGKWKEEEETWVFKNEDIKEVKGFTDTYGVSSSTTPNIVELFMEVFSDCKIDVD